MRLAIIATLLGPAIGSGGLAGQQAATDSSLRSFRTPASPAFILLGVAPTAVERPGTPQSLVASLVAALRDKDFPPKRYALEVAPYWLTRHRRLTFDQYSAPSLWQSLKQTFSISVATAGIADPDSGTVLGFGVRAGYLSGRDASLVRPLRDSILLVEDSILHATTAAEETRLQGRLKPMTLRMQHVLRSERLGWTIGGAAAALMNFPGDIAEHGKVSRAAVWLTSGYRLSRPKADVLAVVRITRDERANPTQSLLDLGGRLVLDKQDLSLSGEYVFRSVTGTGVSRRTYQLSAAVEYRVAKDIFVTATLGRGVEESGAGTSRLIAQVGVDFGLGPLPLLITRPRG